MTDANDTLLIKRIVEHKEIRHYDALMKKYEGRIKNLAYMMIGNRHDAEDLAQESFIRAFKALPNFQRKAKFSSWLYQITINLCKDYLKARSRSARNIEEEHLETVDAGTGDTGVQTVLGDETSGKVAQALHKIQAIYREAFVRRELLGQDYSEIATATSTSADTVRVRAYRAREMLRELLAKDVDTFWREKAAKEK